jgi:hypothetical protein
VIRRLFYQASDKKEHLHNKETIRLKEKNFAEQIRHGETMTASEQIRLVITLSIPVVLAEISSILM